jgi:hypothetical protein
MNRLTRTIVFLRRTWAKLLMRLGWYQFSILPGDTIVLGGKSCVVTPVKNQLTVAGVFGQRTEAADTEGWFSGAAGRPCTSVLSA